jgi:hypothetical protein
MEQSRTSILATLAYFVGDLNASATIDDDEVNFTFDCAQHDCWVSEEHVFTLRSYMPLAIGYPLERLNAIIRDENEVRPNIFLMPVEPAHEYLVARFQAEVFNSSGFRRAFFEHIRELAVSRRSIKSAMSAPIDEPIPPFYFEVEPIIFEEFRSRLVGKMFSPTAYVPDTDEVTTLLLSLDATRIRRRRTSSDSKCVLTIFSVTPRPSARYDCLLASRPVLLFDAPCMTYPP